VTEVAAVVKTPQRRTTLLSQLSQCENEGGEKARAATDAMSPVQVSQALGSYLPVPFIIIELLFFHLVIAKKESFWHAKHFAKEKGGKGNLHLSDLSFAMCYFFCSRSEFFMPFDESFRIEQCILLVICFAVFIGSLTSLSCTGWIVSKKTGRDEVSIEKKHAYFC
jgi:hypothetical protein